MIKATRAQWIKFVIVLVLWLVFLVWLKSWLGLVVVPFIFDAYITKKIPWTWWRKSKNPTVVTVMGWVDAIVFALAHATGMIQQKDMEKVGIIMGIIGLILGYSMLTVLGSNNLL